MSIAERALLSRAAALLVLAALVGALWVGPVAAWRDLLGRTTQDMGTAERTLLRYRALAAATPETAAPADETSVLLPDVPDAQAVALLQETLKGAASAAQVEIRGLQVLQGDTLAGTSRIGVRLKGRGDIAGLDRLLYAIEASRPVLYPDNLHIQSLALQPAAAPAPLDFQLDVSGFKAGPPA